MGAPLTARDVLEVWERGLTSPPLQRALDLLMVGYPELSLEQRRELPIGQRDTCLLAIREALFGSRLNSLTICPQCGEQLEMIFETAQLRAVPLAPSASGTYTITVEDCEVEFRLPNSGDMFQIADLTDHAEARRRLFELCVRQAKRAGALIPAQGLPDAVIDAAAAQMAELDPQADMQIALTCPTCSQQWSTTFDIASFLWIEINAWALRLLHDIHRLASAYGWREIDILSLSPVRRQLYLELIG